jgi:hypothetical protein
MFRWSGLTRSPERISFPPNSAFAFSPVFLRPDCDGSVHIKSADRIAPSEFEYKFLRISYDGKASLHGMRVFY